MRHRRVILTAVSPFDPIPFLESGYDPVRISTIRLLPNIREIRILKERLLERRHDSAAFMSPRAIEIVNPNKEIIRILSEMRLFAVGPSTKKSLAKFGLRNVKMPDEYTSKALSAYITSENLKSPFSSLALIRSSFADNSMFDELFSKGIPVDEYRIYSPKLNLEGVEELLKELRAGADFVVFTSHASFELMWKFLPYTGCRELEELLTRTRVVAIGPETAKALKSFGIDPLVAPDHSIAGVSSFIKVM
ncbi:MAG: uroporphyrinogen-III synthase [Candidatus Methanomethyliaceae archaeon]